MNKRRSQNRITINIAIIGGLLVALVLIMTTVWTGVSAQRGTNRAVHSVSNFYLRELAGRRGQVVASNLQNNIQNMNHYLQIVKKKDSLLKTLKQFRGMKEMLF